jgi:hypothetical protein
MYTALIVHLLVIIKNKEAVGFLMPDVTPSFIGSGAGFVWRSLKIIVLEDACESR